MDEQITLQFDGGSRGNPGPAGIGVVLAAADGTPILTLGRFIGRATNNYAEYVALITGLKEAMKLGVRKLMIRGDSELVVKQMTGEYKVRHPDLRPLYLEARDLLREFDHHKIEHNYRHKNELADKLANLAMDRKADVTDVDDPAPRSGQAVGNAPPRTGVSARPATASPLDEPSPVAPSPGDRFACARCACVISVDRPSSIRPHQLKPFVCQCGARLVPAPRAEDPKE